MATLLLTRDALGRVLRSLVLAERRVARGPGDPAPPALSRLPHAPWGDDLPLGTGGLDCDSLHLLSLAAAVNEMFHLHEAGTEADLLSAGRFGDWIDVVTAAWRDGVDSVTFTTSGSTGRPKRCTLAAAHLRVEVDALAERWSDRRRVVALAPAHHIYGFLFTALLPDRLRAPCVAAEAFGPSRLASTLRAGDLVVSFPERWAYLERSLPAWPAGVAGVVSTAPCPPHLVADLRAKGLARMTEVYGSSETAGIAWRDAPEAPYRLMPQWRFADPFDEAAPLLAHAAGGRWPLMDRVARTGTDAFRLAGRRDGMVQVGGINVSPAAVAARLRERPGVEDVTVRLMRPEEGSRLKAFLVPAANMDPDRLCAEIAAWTAAHLPAAERPGSIAHGIRLPVNALGKAADW